MSKENNSQRTTAPLSIYKMRNRYVEYRWSLNPQTCAYHYIVPAIFAMLKALNLNKDVKILDAGCGGGALINDLYTRGFVNVWGFDASQSGINLAKKSFLEIADRFFNHDAYEPKLPPGIPQDYDLIISMEVIEHLYSPEIYLENIHHWLNKNGYLIITTPYHGYIKNLAIALANKCDWHFNPLSCAGHIKFFSQKSLSLLLEKEGFHIIKFKGVGRIPYIWKSMIFVAHKRV